MSLHVTYDDIRREIGRLHGFGRDPDEWSSTSREYIDVEDAIKRGSRSFYWPVREDGPYYWSFMRKKATLQASTTAPIDLPEDFSGNLLEANWESSDLPPLTQIPENELISLQNDTSIIDTGLEAGYYNIRAKARTTNSPTQYEMSFHPLPTSAWNIIFRYAVLPEPLTYDNQYHLGTAVHSECFLDACLAAAETSLNPEGAPGYYAQKYQNELAKCVAADEKMLIQ